jgi:hypothetical protein
MNYICSVFIQIPQPYAALKNLALCYIFLLQPEQEFRMALKMGGFGGPILVSYWFALWSTENPAVSFCPMATFLMYIKVPCA